MPFQNRQRNRLELVNEQIIQSLTALLFCFSDWMPSQESQFNMGFCVIILLAIDFVLNMLMLMKTICKWLWLICKRYYRRIIRGDATVRLSEEVIE